MKRVVILAGCVMAALLPLTVSARPAGRDQRERKIPLSTIATAEAAMDAWLSEAVPAHYARQTVAAMRRKLAGWIEQQEASTSNALDPSPGTLQTFRNIGEMLDHAEQEIEAADRPAARRNLEEIRSSVTGARQELAPRS